MTVTLILGGARSGKSRCAEALARGASARPVYVATAEAWDDEMRERIARHRADRGGGWTTVEEPLELARAVRAHASPGAAVLVDCLTLWVSNLMGAGRNVDAAGDALLDALARAEGDVVLVANEVGLGIVPDNAMARAFRDHAGRLNQRVAAAADRVVFVVAGIPMTVKGPA